MTPIDRSVRRTRASFFLGSRSQKPVRGRGRRSRAISRRYETAGFRLQADGPQQQDVPHGGVQEVQPNAGEGRGLRSQGAQLLSVEDEPMIAVAVQ